MVVDQPKTLNEVLTSVGATTIQTAVIDDFLGRLEARILTILLAFEGLKAMPGGEPIPAEAIRMAGYECMTELRKHRASIAHSRLIAPMTETAQ